MKIISKFRDYYDIGSSMGVDESITYVRNLQKVERPNSDLPLARGYFSNGRRLQLIETILDNRRPRWPKRAFEGTFHILGFCGKLYPFFTCMVNTPYASKRKTHYEASEEAARDYLYSRTLRIHHDRETVEKALEDMKRGFPSVIEDDALFHELGVPSFIIPFQGSSLDANLAGEHSIKCDNLNDRIYLSPCLADFEFYKVVDSFTAYQEISMYISGVLGVNKVPPVQISDEDMRDAKGFDRMSFKKEPTKRKKKKR